VIYLCLQIGKYDRQFWEQSVEQEVLKVLLIELLTTMLQSLLVWHDKPVKTLHFSSRQRFPVDECVCVFVVCVCVSSNKRQKLQR